MSVPSVSTGLDPNEFAASVITAFEVFCEEATLAKSERRDLAARIFFGCAFSIDELPSSAGNDA